MLRHRQYSYLSDDFTLLRSYSSVCDTNWLLKAHSFNASAKWQTNVMGCEERVWQLTNPRSVWYSSDRQADITPITTTHPPPPVIIVMVMAASSLTAFVTVWVRDALALSDPFVICKVEKLDTVIPVIHSSRFHVVITVMMLFKGRDVMSKLFSSVFIYLVILVLQTERKPLLSERNSVSCTICSFWHLELCFMILAQNKAEKLVNVSENVLRVVNYWHWGLKMDGGDVTSSWEYTVIDKSHGDTLSSNSNNVYFHQTFTNSCLPCTLVPSIYCELG